MDLFAPSNHSELHSNLLNHRQSSKCCISLVSSMTSLRVVLCNSMTAMSGNHPKNKPDQRCVPRCTHIHRPAVDNSSWTMRHGTIVSPNISVRVDSCRSIPQIPEKLRVLPMFARLHARLRALFLRGESPALILKNVFRCIMGLRVCRFRLAWDVHLSISINVHSMSLF